MDSKPTICCHFLQMLTAAGQMTILVHILPAYGGLTCRYTEKASANHDAE